MKASFLSVLILVLRLSTLRGEDYCTEPQQLFSEYYVFSVPEKLMEQAPKWNSSESPLPLSPEIAAKNAVLCLASAFPEIPRWRVESITLKRLFSDRWIYLVEASDITTAVAGIPWKLTVPVLLDGVTVAPAKVPANEQE